MKEKCLCIIFQLTGRLRVHGQNVFWGILLPEQQVQVFVGTVNLANPLSPPRDLSDVR